MRRQILIVQRRLPHYRVAFFNSLRDALSRENLELKLLIGSPTKDERLKEDEATCAWADHAPALYFFRDQICWQPFYGAFKSAHLSIVTQQNSLIFNHLLLALPRDRMLAFWGHGANFQSAAPNGIREKFKRWTSHQVDWWFAYTELSAKLIRNTGFPASRITVVNNSLDATSARADIAIFGRFEMQQLKKNLGLCEGPVAIFIGSLYKHKRLDFLVSAACKIRAIVPNFNLLILGDGPEREFLVDATRARPWIKLLGARTGAEKSKLLCISDLILNPGLVGLSIVDSFVYGKPMVTTDCGLHSPEIAYLTPGENGVITTNDVDSFVLNAVELFSNQEYLGSLAKNCYQSAEKYSLVNMVKNFTSGIVRCLERDY